MKRPPGSQHYIEPGILLVHKPVGMSSFDVIRKLRPILGTRKIGHAGTLDPLAHGLMIVGIDSGTKKLNNYLKLSKIYLAEVLVGKSTTTGDQEGETVEERLVKEGDMKKQNIQQVVDSLAGSHMLAVPVYSAIKVQGKALYAYARAGQTPPYIPEKEMTIHSVQLLDHYRLEGHHVIKLRLDVSSGTYIRSLGELLGERLGYPASLKDLYRISIGDYLDENAYRFKQDKPSRPRLIRAIIELLLGKR